MIRNDIIPILLKFGFIEKTNTVYPDHWIRFEQSGESNKIKRSFVFGRCYIKFDYENIDINYNGTEIINLDSKMELHQLQSLLYFLNCESNLKTFYKNNWNGILNFQSYFDNKIRYIDFMRNKQRDKFITQLNIFNDTKKYLL